MSRTYKDKPNKLIWGDYTQDTLRVPYVCEYIGCYSKEVRSHISYYTLRLPTTKPKVRKTVNNEWAWYSAAPSWWNNMFHTKPIRGNFRKFSVNVVKSNIADIEDMLEPSDSKAPHKYYY